MQRNVLDVQIKLNLLVLQVHQTLHGSMDIFTLVEQLTDK